MKEYFKLKTWLITTLMFVVAFGLSLAIVYYEFALKQNIRTLHASSSDNVSGFAWNSNIGWLSFNSTNCDKNSNGYVDTNIITNGCNGNDDSSTPVRDYGVKIDLATGHFSGYAWSSGVGWISFNEIGAPDYTFNANCLTPGSCAAASSCTACYNFADQKVYGWGKILSLGSDGWIKLRKFPSDSGGDYGVSIAPATGDFSGWAWNAGDLAGEGIGWISFNCLNESPSCSGTNYKVNSRIDRPPAVANMTAPNWNYTQASTNALHANLLFDFIDPDTGSFGSAYQIIVTKADNTPVLDTGKCTGYNTPLANCKIDNSICMKNGVTGCINSGDCTCQYPLEPELNYNTAYKWSVTVWDNYDVVSALAAYNTSPDTDNDDGAIPTFTTYKHKFPVALATWFPANPSRGEKVEFNAFDPAQPSQRFFSGSPQLPVNCTLSTCDRLWTLPAGAIFDTEIGDNNVATVTPIIIFNNTGINIVTLRITDNGDTGVVPYYSIISLPININAKLPKWQEVKPK